MRILAGIALTVATIACNHATGPTAPLNMEFSLGRGEAVAIEDTAAEIRFNGVTNDSRCPSDVVCITAGDAHVQIGVRSGRLTRDYVLHTGDMKPVAHDDLTIHLVRLTPYPLSSRTISADEYRVTLRVTR